MTPCTWIFVIEVNTVGSPVQTIFSPYFFLSVYLKRNMRRRKVFTVAVLFNGTRLSHDSSILEENLFNHLASICAAVSETIHEPKHCSSFIPKNIRIHLEICLPSTTISAWVPTSFLVYTQSDPIAPMSYSRIRKAPGIAQYMVAQADSGSIFLCLSILFYFNLHLYHYLYTYTMEYINVIMYFIKNKLFY